MDFLFVLQQLKCGHKQVHEGIVLKLEWLWLRYIHTKDRSLSLVCSRKQWQKWSQNPVAARAHLHLQ